ncbi:MAG: PHP domain-containing protein [Promethearchaeota archaeon]
MKRFFDHHVHTGYSRCVSKPYSVEDGLKAALDRGFIEGIGISNHCHFNSPDQDHLFITREEINAVNEAVGETKVLLGVELDIDHPDGMFKLTRESLSVLDYVVAGPHNMPHRSLALPDLEKDEIDEYFGVLRDILVNSFSKNPIDIWPHPFLQEIEIGGLFFKEQIFEILEDVLPVIEEKEIAVEISSTFYRDKKSPPLSREPSNELNGWLEIVKITTQIYKKMLETTSVKFSFASDAHSINLVGDIYLPIVVARFLGIPGDRILHLEDLKGRH